MTLYLTELKIGASQLLPQPVPVAQVIPTPTVQKAPNYVVYMTGSGRLVINGTNFRDKYLSLTFDPPLERNQDYILSVRSPTMAVLTRTFTSSWRPEPGPLRVRSIDTGGGAIRLNLASGGVLVAEVQANLGAHGVSVRSTPDVSIYQTTSELTINGDGFSPDSNILRFANGILGRGVNYTTVSPRNKTTRPLHPNRLAIRGLPCAIRRMYCTQGGGLLLRCVLCFGSIGTHSYPVPRPKLSAPHI